MGVNLEVTVSDQIGDGEVMSVKIQRGKSDKDPWVTIYDENTNSTHINATLSEVVLWGQTALRLHREILNCVAFPEGEDSDGD